LNLELKKAKRPKRAKCTRNCVHRAYGGHCGKRTNITLDPPSCPFYAEKLPAYLKEAR
jgi:hypothetical protein